MRKIIVMVIGITLVSITVPAVAAVAAIKPEGKDECLLYGINCPNAVDSLPERIKKLKVEIGKGENVYTREELKELERKLKEANDMLRSLQKR